MDKKMKTKWLKALRSDEYVQGTGRLVSPDDRFCCFGVICNISNMGEWKYKDIEGWYYETDSEDNFYTGILPPALLKAVNLSRGTELDLANMNDRGKTFSQIADWIEENL